MLDQNGLVVRKVDGSGVVTTLAGNNKDSADYGSFVGDGIPAVQGSIAGFYLAMSPLGVLHVSDQGHQRIRSVSSKSMSMGATLLPGGAMLVPAVGSDEIHEFDVNGRHVATRSRLRGATRALLGYDNNTGLLTSITDGDNNVTHIDRSGSMVTITAPHGQVTTLALDANGYLESLTNPAAEVTRFKHSSTGLLTELTDPKYNQHHFEYSPTGLLTKDTDALSGSPGTTMTRTESASGWTVNMTSPEGRPRSYAVDMTPTPSTNTALMRRTLTAPDQTTTTLSQFANETYTTSLANGTTVTSIQTNDPRFGLTGGFASKETTQTPLHTLTRQQSRTVTQSDPLNPFSVTGQTDTIWLNQNTDTCEAGCKKYTRVYDAVTSTVTTTTPTGRTMIETLDDHDRVVKVEVPNIAPIETGYDSLGRIHTITQASASDGTRSYEINYNDITGFIDRIVDNALNQTTRHCSRVDTSNTSPEDPAGDDADDCSRSSP